MSQELSVTIDTNLPRFEQAWKKFGSLMPQAVLRGCQSAALLGARRTINRKLTNANPPYLNRQKGMNGGLVYTVAQSLKQERATLAGELVRAGYGTDRDYGYKHEFGGTYTEQVKAHTRRVKSRSIFSGRHKQAQGIAFVRAHTRQRTYRARHMFADGLRESEPAMLLPLLNQINGLWESGQLRPWREYVDGLEPVPAGMTP